MLDEGHATLFELLLAGLGFLALRDHELAGVALGDGAARGLHQRREIRVVVGLVARRRGFLADGLGHPRARGRGRGADLSSPPGDGAEPPERPGGEVTRPGDDDGAGTPGTTPTDWTTPPTETIDGVPVPPELSRAALTAIRNRFDSLLAGTGATHGVLVVDLEGYTDNVGDPTHNIQLSQRRSEAVRRFLVEKGVEMNRIHSIGLGDIKPSADNTTPKGREQNRRVMVRFFAPSE